MQYGGQGFASALHFRMGETQRLRRPETKHWHNKASRAQQTTGSQSSLLPFD
jgi:hypothetical protein